MNAINGPAIFPFRANLDVDYGGNGIGNNITIGYRRFEDYIIVEYDSIGRCCDGSSSYKFEAVLYRSGHMKFQYDRLIEPIRPTIGIQAGPDGPALMYGCGAFGHPPSDSLAIWFALQNGHPERVTDLTGETDGTNVSLAWSDPIEDTNGNPLVPDSVIIYRGAAIADSQIGHVTIGSETYSALNQPQGSFLYLARAKAGELLGDPLSVWVVNGTPSYFSDFESDDGNWVPNGIWQWGTPTNPEGPIAHSGDNVWAVGLTEECQYGLCGQLVLDPGLQVTSNIAKLEFWTWWDMGLQSVQKDGVNIKSSVDGGATWVVLSPENGYTDFVLTGNGCIGSEQAWGSFSHGWQHIAVSIGHLVGTTPKFMVTFSTYGNSEPARTGFFFDDVMLWGMGPRPNGQPNRVAEMNSISNGSSNLTLSWTDPDHDTNGNPISPDSILVYRGAAIADSQIASIGGGIERITLVDQSEGYYQYFTRSKLGQFLSEPQAIWAVIGSPSYFSNFDSDSGDWTTDGEWEWGLPTNWNGPRPHTEANVWAVGLAEDYDQNACGNLYLNLGKRVLWSDAKIELWYWRRSEFFGDGCNVKASVDGGNTWQRVTPIGGYNGLIEWGTCSFEEAVWQGTDGAPWLRAILPIGQFVNQTPIFRMRFGTDGFGESYPGFFLDDVLIWGLAPHQGVVGVVTSGGANDLPLRDVWVITGNDSVATNALGQYVLPLTQGVYDIRFWHPMYCDTLVGDVFVDTDLLDTINVSLFAPDISVENSTLSFLVVGDMTLSQPFSIYSTGDCPATFAVFDSADWLSVLPSTGDIVQGDSVEVSVIVQGNGLVPDEYESTLYVSINSSGRVLQVPVLLSVVSSASSERHLPTEFAIEQNSPNPFNPTTTLRFSLPKRSLVELTVYDVLGRVVMSHQLGMLNAGVHDVVVDGAEWSSGIYFASVFAGEWREVVKMALVR